MCDIIEFTTPPKPHNIFYKVTSNATTFAIRAEANAAIGLSAVPVNSGCEIWILVGYNGRCWIKSCRGVEQSALNPALLCSEEYRKFWLTWYNGTVSFGEEGCSTPIVSCRERTQDFTYVTFTVITQMNHVHWRINMPPALESSKYKAIRSHLHWISIRNPRVLPDNALIGGYENENLYIARASHMGSLTPGKFVPSVAKAFISWDGRANEKTERFEILCGFNVLWVPATLDKIPVGAFAVGYSEMGSEPLYIGRALHDGHLIPGKFHSPYKCLLFSYNGRECSARNFEILVLPEKNERGANNTFLFDTHSYVQPGEYGVNDSDED